MKTKGLVFTGERLIPGLKDSTFLYGEHMLRYLFAAQFTRGKTVADIGCGVGYGAKILAESGVKLVYASDNSQEAINYARSHYNHKKIKYEVADACFLTNANQSIDLVVACELIEHMPNYSAFLEEVKRVLKPSGLFLLSTPNVKVYFEAPHINSFHHKEYTEEEIEQALKLKFKYVKVLYQLDSFASLVTDNKQVNFNSKLIEKSKVAPSYFIVLASDSPLPKIIDFNTTLFTNFNLDSLAKNLNTLQREVIMLNKIITEIYASKTWKLLSYYQLTTQKIKHFANIYYWEYKIIMLLQVILPKDVVKLLKFFHVRLNKFRINSFFYLNNLPYILGRQTGDYSVLNFAAISWNHKFQRPQHLATQLSIAGHNVFYIEPEFNVVNNLNLSREAVERRVEIKKVAQNIFTVKLVSAKRYVIYQDLLADSTSIKYLAWSIQSLIQKAGIKEAVFKVDWPFWQSIIKEFKYPVIYDCMDEHSGFWTTTWQIIDLEKKLIESANLVLASSDGLLRKIKKLNKRVVLVNNACDFEHFNRIAASNFKGSEAKNPTIGYFGAIADWLDDALVEYVARKRPNWNFVLIGNIDSRAKLGTLRKYKNIRIINEIHYKDLPGAISKFRAFFIPFKINKLILATNPVKMYEIFATGRPSVWTNLPEIKKIGNLALASKDKHEFLINLEQAIKENNTSLAQQRIAFARKNTWDDRLFEIEDAVNRYIFPKVSVVMLSYNTLKYTKLCLDSVFNNSNWANLEVVVVDNGSSDGSQDLLKQYQKRYPNLKTILLEKNTGFAGGNNIGIKEVTGKYVILLNSDTIATKGWISGLISHLDNRKVGLVGPLTNAIGNEAKIDVSYKNLKGIEGFASKLSLENRGKSFEINDLAFFCVAGRRSVWKKIGSLDERFQFGTFEDDDYCLRVKKAGYKLICAEDVFIHHFLGKTREKIPKMDNIFESNKQEFQNKWQSTWVPHRYRATNEVIES